MKFTGTWFESIQANRSNTVSNHTKFHMSIINFTHNADTTLKPY